MPVQELSCFAPNIAEYDLEDDEVDESGDKEEQSMRRMIIDDDDDDIEVLNESIEVDVTAKVFIFTKRFFKILYFRLKSTKKLRYLRCQVSHRTVGLHFLTSM